MKIILFALFGILNFSYSEIEFVKEVDFECTLSATGYGTVEGLGRIPITISSTGATCEEVANYLRGQIIELQFSIRE